MAKSPRCQTSSSGLTVPFQRATIASFIAATDANGRRYSPKAPPCPKCVSLVKKIAINARCCCAEASSDGNVSLWKIVPFEQDGQVKLTGAGIGKAVTHVKPSRVTPLAKAIESRNGGAAYL